MIALFISFLLIFIAINSLNFSFAICFEGSVDIRKSILWLELEQRISNCLKRDNLTVPLIHKLSLLNQKIEAKYLIKAIKAFKFVGST